MSSGGSSSAEAPKVDRVRTGTRDLFDTRERLERWLVDRLPEGSGPEVSPIEAPVSNGMSSETLLFEATWSDGPERTARSLVARLAPDPANKPVFPVYDLEQQFRTLQLLAEAGTVPVPRVLWCEGDAEPLGSPFFVMERVNGEVPPDVMPYNLGSWLSQAATGDQARLQETSIRTLAAIHALDPERFAFLALPGSGTPLRRHVEAQWEYYRWSVEGTPSPLIERCFAWLDEHWPAEEGPAALSWGDARIGNVIFRDFEPVAVLDWEMACIAPREVDLAWFVVLHRFFEDIAAKYGLPGMPHFLRRDDVIATYESMTGYTPRDIDFYTMYAALRHGIIMNRVQRRSIHFGEAVMPDDVDDLILHRAMLEEMLAGTYWERV